MRRHSRALILTMGLVGCSGPSHLPPPWALPGAALGSVVGNAAYAARRGRVKGYLMDHGDVLRIELPTGTGLHFDRVADLASIAPDRRDAVAAEFAARPDIYIDNANPDAIDIEAVTVLLMVYGH